MRHQNSVFHDLPKRIPWAVFDRLVDEHNADRHIRRLPEKSQLVALLHAQFSGASSLREIAAGMESHAARLYFAGARPVTRSTLADANAPRPSEVFGGPFLLLSPARKAQQAVQSPLAFARLVRANLMPGKRIDRLLESEKIDQTTTNQMVLEWA